MNWDAIGAIGEMIGSVAVLATLGYLAVQVRHAREDVRRSISNARSEANRDALAALAEERTLPLMLKANAFEGALPNRFVAYAMENWAMTEEEAWRLNFALATGWQFRLQLIPHVANMSPMERHDFDTVLRVLYGTPSVQRTYYETIIKERAHPGAVQYIENVLAQPG